MATQTIEKSISLKAPRDKVWEALTDAEKFGTWFRCKLDGPFESGKRTTGHITYPGYEHLKMEIWIERIEARTLFSFRWHPHAVDEKRDYSGEPTTRVEFHLAEAGDGTTLKVIESGFENIPEERRDLAFRMNAGGWEEQLSNVAAYVGGQ